VKGKDQLTFGKGSLPNDKAKKRLFWGQKLQPDRVRKMHSGVFSWEGGGKGKKGGGKENGLGKGADQGKGIKREGGLQSVSKKINSRYWGGTGLGVGPATCTWRGNEKKKRGAWRVQTETEMSLRRELQRLITSIGASNKKRERQDKNGERSKEEGMALGSGCG